MPVSSISNLEPVCNVEGGGVVEDQSLQFYILLGDIQMKCQDQMQKVHS